MKIDPSGDHEIIAAIKFDEQAKKVADSAAVLAERAEKPLRLVHIFEPVEVPGGLRERALFDSYHGVAPGLYDERSFIYRPDGEEGADPSQRKDLVVSMFEQAEAALAQIARGLGRRHLEVRTSVLIGTYPEAFLELAPSHSGGLIVAGAEKKDPGIFQSKLRKTFRLMSGSSLPVLIIPDVNAAISIVSDRPLRVLLADDLSDSSWHAIRNLTRLVKEFRLVVDIMHVHVEPVHTAAMVLSPEYELEIWPGILVKDRLINDRHEHIKTRMRNRSRNLKKATLDLGGSYHFELWHGSVAEELKRAVEVHDADISVFGKHHFFHANPLTFGQMGYKKMIGLNSAILVSPESGTDLHA